MLTPGVHGVHVLDAGSQPNRGPHSSKCTIRVMEKLVQERKHSLVKLESEYLLMLIYTIFFELAE